MLCRSGDQMYLLKLHLVWSKETKNILDNNMMLNDSIVIVVDSRRTPHKNNNNKYSRDHASYSPTLILTSPNFKQLSTLILGGDIKWPL